MKKINWLKEKAERKAMELLYAKEKGEGFVDTAFKILIAVVIGALILFGMYTIMDDTVLPTLTTKITSLFAQAPSGT